MAANRCKPVQGPLIGSPFSVALCLMFVSISEQIWFNFATTLSSMQLLACMLRYVDSRMVLLPSQNISHPTFEVFLDQDFYGQPFVLQEEPDPEFWGFQVDSARLKCSALFTWSPSPPPVLMSIPHVVIPSPKDPIHPYRPIKDWTPQTSCTSKQDTALQFLVWATSCSKICCSVSVVIYSWSCISTNQVSSCFFIIRFAFVFQWLAPCPCPRSVYPVSLPMSRLRSS